MKTNNSLKILIANKLKSAEYGMSSALIGFAFWQAWQMLVMHAGALVPITSTMAGSLIGTSTIFVVTTIAIPIGVFVKMKANESFRIDCVIVCVGGFTGTLFIALTSLAPDYNAAPIFIIGVLLYSISNALILLLWGKFWSTLGVAWVARSLSCSYVLAFGLFFAIELLPWGMQVVAISLLLPVSVFCLRSGEKCDKRLQPTATTEEPKALQGICIFIIIVSLSFGYMQSGFAILEASTYTTTVFGGMAVAALGVGLLIFFLYRSQKPEVVLIYNMIIPFIVSGLLLFLSGFQGLKYLEFGLLMIGVYCLDILIMLVATDISFRMGRSVYLYFGTGFFLARGSALTARLTSMHLIDIGFLNPLFFNYGVLTLLFCLVVVGMLIFSKSDLMTLYRSGEKEQAAETVFITQPTISTACEQITSDYSLTPRESEIFEMLARGRTIPYICDELVIAENTGKRHVSNIYRKLCIYDRQGLHDIVERYLSNIA